MGKQIVLYHNILKIYFDKELKMAKTSKVNFLK
jgi:hypothetical protein